MNMAADGAATTVTRRGTCASKNHLLRSGWFALLQCNCQGIHVGFSYFLSRTLDTVAFTHRLCFNTRNCLSVCSVVTISAMFSLIKPNKAI